MLTLLVAPFVFPLVIMVKISLQGDGLGNFTAVLTHANFGRFFINSAVVAAGVIIIVWVCTTLAGYAFAKLRFRGKELLFSSILVGLMLPAVALLVPLFSVVDALNLVDNPLSVVLPLAAVTIPFTLLMMRNYLTNLPDELLDAAMIDGCGSFGSLIRIVLPLSRPITAVVVLWSFLTAWNEFFLPLVFLRSDDKQLVTQVPQFFVGIYGSDQTKIFAAIVLISLPLILLYLVLQRYFERGLTGGALR